MAWTKTSGRLSQFNIDKIKGIGYLPTPKGNKGALIQWMKDFIYGHWDYLQNKSDAQIFAMSRSLYEWYLENVDENAKPPK